MKDTRTVKVAMAGCGTVGSAVAEIVVNRAEGLAARTGLRFEITKVLVADPGKKRDAPLDSSVFTTDPAELAAAEPDMLVEVIGGADTARDVVLAALRKGTPVVTANKALLALHGVEVYRAAHQADTCIAFESSCAGGLPIVGAILRGLTANRTDSLAGIFNSTCNFILTEMLAREVPFADALADAQRSGYAEADPTLDVNGQDTAHKLTILASLAFGANIDFNRIVTDGIDKLDLVDLRMAEELGYACKLLGLARQSGPAGDHLALQVRPMLVPNSHWLAGRSGTDSGVCVDGDAVGSTIYAGAGAGGLPTASGVVADMIDVATGSAQRTFAQLRIYNDRTEPAQYVEPDDLENAYYIRLNTYGMSVTPDDIEEACAKASIPVVSVTTVGGYAAVAIITERIAEGRFRAALEKLTAIVEPDNPPAILRILAD